MNVFVVETYVVKPDKIEANNALLQRLAGVLKSDSAKFRMVKSYRTFTETFGTWGYSFEIWEMADFSDWNRVFDMMMKDDKLKTFPEEFFNIIIPGTHQLHLMAQTVDYAVK